jgi:hypothetical protein
LEIHLENYFPWLLLNFSPPDLTLPSSRMTSVSHRRSVECHLLEEPPNSSPALSSSVAGFCSGPVLGPLSCSLAGSTQLSSGVSGE